jgi:hypothetical protein
MSNARMSSSWMRCLDAGNRFSSAFGKLIQYQRIRFPAANGVLTAMSYGETCVPVDGREIRVLDAMNVLTLAQS